MRNYLEITPEWEQENKIVFYGHEDDEHLQEKEVDEYIADILDRDDQFPTTIEVTAFRRMKPNVCGLDILEYIFERLDPELGDPDGCAEEPTPDMLVAADALALIVNTQYPVWACESVETFIVDVPAWIAANRPDWIKATTP